MRFTRQIDSDFNRRVKTPRGEGYAVGQLPDGRIQVTHAWEDLDKTFRNNYKGRKTAIKIFNYDEEDVEPC
jgi:hypothetical protein